MEKATSYECGLRDMQQSLRWPIEPGPYIRPDDAELDIIEYLKGKVECLSQAVISHEVRISALVETNRLGQDKEAECGRAKGRV